AVTSAVSVVSALYLSLMRSFGGGPAGPGRASGSGSAPGAADVTITRYTPGSSPCWAGMLYRPSLIMAPPPDPSDGSLARKGPGPWPSGLPWNLTSPETA